MALKIRKSSIVELEAAINIKAILEEYAAESAIKGLPTPEAKAELYKFLENSGSLHVIASFLDDTLIGYITILAPIIPHYGIMVAVVESFFVSKENRKTGAGIKLLHEAEAYSKEIGSPGLLVSAPFGGNLAEVMPHLGYSETNRVFFKCLN